MPPRIDEEKKPNYLLWICVSVLGAATIGVLGRLLFVWYVGYQAEQIIETTTKAAAAQAARTQQQIAAINERARAERQAREEQAQREKRAVADAKLATARAAKEEAERKERAWQRFYKPSTFCTNPDNSSAMECVNGYVRAKRAFEAKWAAGEL